MKKRVYFVLAAVTVFLAGSLFAAQEKTAEEPKLPEVKVTVQQKDLPDVIKQAVAENFPGGNIVNIEKELAGERLVQYDAVIRSDGKMFDVEISPEGKIIEIKEQKKPSASADKQGKQWTKSFMMEKRTFSATGRNLYWILEPGHQLTFENPAGDKLVITVLNDTKTVNGIETRVVEEREWEDGELVEVSRNWFAICNETNDVFYFGEEVDDYEDGKIVGHGGAWQAGENGASAGIVMPGTFLLGARYYQEIAEGKAMDRAQNDAMGLTVETKAGTFKDCVQVVETSPLESGESIKIYAPGLGMIVDDNFKLTEVKTASK